MPFFYGYAKKVVLLRKQHDMITFLSRLMAFIYLLIAHTCIYICSLVDLIFIPFFIDINTAGYIRDKFMNFPKS